jgi:peptidoglycan/xylan/chitin deacetylase (PgdA/CDA1 family)
MAHDRGNSIRIATIMTGVGLAALVLGAAPSRASGPVDGRIITHGRRDAPMVALTFDLCPTHAPVELDERIVDALVAAHAPATFFVSGRWARARPDAVRQLAAEPLFEIANHTYHHPHLLRSSDDDVRSELTITEAALRELTGRSPRWFRPPFGEVDARIGRIAAEVGLGTIEFDVASGDPSPGLTAARLVQSVLERTHAGSIVVMHANHRRFPTAEALPAIIAGLRRRALRLVTVSELVDGSAEVEPPR